MEHEPAGLPALSPADIGRANRARVIHALQVHGALSRSQLADRLQISRGSVTAIVAPLLREGILHELAPARSGGGKPPRPLWFAADRFLGALLISATRVTLAAVRLDGTIIATRTEEFDGAAQLRRLLRARGRELFDRRLLGIGVAAAGAVDVPSGTILRNYRSPSLDDLPLGRILSQEFDVPAFVDHHPRVQAIGDLWFGAGRGRQNFASVLTGEALGLGVVLQGRVLAGPRGAGGEMGHMVVADGSRRCACGQRGCWQMTASLPWLRSHAARSGLAGASELTCRALVHQSAGPARTVLQDYARALALGIANVEQLLGCGTYILHGDAADGGQELATMVCRDVAARVPGRRSTLQVLSAPRPDEASLLGAAGMVMLGRYAAHL